MPTFNKVSKCLKKGDTKWYTREFIFKRGLMSPCVRIVVTPNNQVKGGNKEQRCPDTVKRENKLY